MARPRRLARYRSRLVAKKLGNSKQNAMIFAYFAAQVIIGRAFRIDLCEFGTPKYPIPHFVGSV